MSPAWPYQATRGKSPVEVIPRRLRLRAGTYYEPSRFEGTSGRQHVTGGFQLRLFQFALFGERHAGFTYTIDTASNYMVNAFSLWLWLF